MMGENTEGSTTDATYMHRQPCTRKELYLYPEINFQRMIHDTTTLYTTL